MKLTDLFKFKLFERKDTADLAVVNENFQTAESEIDKRLLKTAVQNTNTVTEAGYALDARQANPNVKGSLGALIDTLNEAFAKHKSSSDHDGRYYAKAEVNDLLSKKATNGGSSQFENITIGSKNYQNLIYTDSGKLWFRYYTGGSEPSYVALESLAKRMPGYLTNMDEVGFGIDGSGPVSYIVFRQSGSPKYMLSVDATHIAYKKYQDGNWVDLWVK